MMKQPAHSVLIRSLLAMALVGILWQPAWAGTLSPEQVRFLQRAESTLYTAQYEKETVIARLDRLESTIFGESQPSLGVPERIARLQSVLEKAAPQAPDRQVSAPPVPKSVPVSPSSVKAAKPVNQSGKKTAVHPATPSSAAGQQNSPGASTASPAPPAFSGESDYPAVSEVEQRVLGRQYVGEALEKRLERLEMQLFQTLQHGALSDRVDNLRLVVLGNSQLQQQAAAAGAAQKGYPLNGGSVAPLLPQQPKTISYLPGYTYNPYTGQYAPQAQPMSAYPYPQAVNPAPQPPMQYTQPVPTQIASASPSANTLPSVNAGSSALPAAASDIPSPDLLESVTEVEKQVLKTTYSGEQIGVRLDRLEMQVFNSTSPEMPAEDRLQRVIAVASAGGDNPNAAQHKKGNVFPALPFLLLPLVFLLL